MIKTKRFIFIFIGLILSALFIAGVVAWVIWIKKTEYLYILILVVYFINTIVAYTILMSKYRCETVRMSWLFVLLALPALGFILFFVFGTIPFSIKSKKNTKYFHKKIYEQYSYTKHFLEKNNSTIFEYNYTTIESPLYRNNSFTMVEKANDLENYIELIRSAKKFIILQNFLIAEGIFFNTIAIELIKKAKEGVKIWLLYDWVGSLRKITSKQIDLLVKSGVIVNIFNPKGLNMFKSLSNFRSHQKCLIIDNKKVFFGSSNITDQYINMDRNVNFFTNNNFVLEGEIVNSLTINFLDNFFSISNATKSQINETREYFKENLKIFKSNEKMNMQFITSGPNISEKNILNTFVNLIQNSKKRIRIITPYFVPNVEIESALINAAKRGVDIQMVFPSKPDEKNWTILLNRTSYKKYIDNGVKIFENYGFLHSKVYVFDDICMFGSCNLDYRSLYINWENAIISDEPKIVKSLMQIYYDTIKNSIRIKDMNQVKYNKFIAGIVQIYKPMV